MDFWSYQEEAKKKSFRLIVLYVVIVALLSFVAAYAIELAWHEYASGGGSAKFYDYYGVEYPDTYTVLGSARFFVILTIIPMLIALLTLFSPVTTDSGGGKVAESLDGVLVAPQSTDPNERRLLNVVEEMALASGLPVPPVYILKNETGINAFAAGSDTSDVVIGVTKGALLYLSRAELEGVIAHEFSHIFNKDVRINLRFAQLLFAFIFLSEAGRVILRSLGRRRGGGGRNDGKGVALVGLIALICYSFGLITAFLGRIIQAGVNRQREFLADASAVQFTRSPDLAGALKKIAGLAQGSNLTETNMANNYGHLFFGEASPGLFSTHPPINERILRIDPAWDGAFTQTALLWEDTFLEEDITLSAAESNPEASESTESARIPGVAKNRPETADFTGSAKIPGAAEYLLTRLSPATAAFVKSEALFRPLELAQADPATPTESPLSPEQQEIYAQLRAACREPLDSCYLVFALLLSDEPKVQARQLPLSGDSHAVKSVTEYKRLLNSLPRKEYVPLIQLAVPALKNLSAEQYAAFNASMLQFIQADENFSFKEWILHQLLVTQVGARYNTLPAGGAEAPAYSEMRAAANTALSFLARLDPDEKNSGEAFALGLKHMYLPSAPMPDTPTRENVGEALETMRRCSKLVRDNFLYGAVAVVAYNKALSEEEDLFLRAVSLCLSRLIPPGALKRLPAPEY